jgi:hypothetical protein
MASQSEESLYTRSWKYYGKREPRVLQMTAFIFALTEFKKFHLLFEKKTEVTVLTYASQV